MRTFEKLIWIDINIRKIVKEMITGQGDDYTTDCLLDYNYFNKHYKMIAIDLSKQYGSDADPKAIQKISFTGNLDWAVFFVTEEVKNNNF